MASYLDRIHVPTLLLQGENDTLFNLNEAAATYQALKARGVPVRMIWQSWGHSDSTPAPGEIDLGNPDPATQYETGRVANWFDHYLKDAGADLGPPFAYFRDWVDYTGNAAPAYGSLGPLPGRPPEERTTSPATDLVTSPLLLAQAAQTLPHRAGRACRPTSARSTRSRTSPRCRRSEYDVPGTERAVEHRPAHPATSTWSALPS